MSLHTAKGYYKIKYLYQTESWGCRGSYCGESGTTLDVHQNVLSKFVKIHVTRCKKSQLSGVDICGFHSSVSLLKCSTSLKKADSEVPYEIPDLLNMKQEPYNAFLDTPFPLPGCFRSSWLYSPLEKYCHDPNHIIL